MVSKVDRRGFKDWLAQRVTAILIGAYAVFILIYIAANPQLSFQQWHNLFSAAWIKVITIVALLCILWHAWIGLWTIFTDYVKNRPTRLILEIIVTLLLVSYLVWLATTLWH